MLPVHVELTVVRASVDWSNIKPVVGIEDVKGERTKRNREREAVVRMLEFGLNLER